MASAPKIKWDESRSPQWKWLLRKKDKKYYKKQKEHDKKRENDRQNAKKHAEIAEMTDCSLKKDEITQKINADLTDQLKKVRSNKNRWLG